MRGLATQVLHRGKSIREPVTDRRATFSELRATLDTIQSTWRFASFFVLITALIVGGPLALARSGHPILGLACGFAGALAWIILFVIGLSRYGKVCYWFLLG